MRLFFVGLLPTLALAAPSRAPVVAFLPSSAAQADLAPLALLVTLRGAELVEGTGKYAELHLKQALAMAELEQLDLSRLPDAKAVGRARAALGADRLVSVSVEKTAKGLVVSGQVHDGKRSTSWTAPPAAGWPAALTQGSEALFHAVTAAEGVAPAKKSAAQPESASEEALVSLGACAAIVLRQPMGIEAPSVLDADELAGAVAACAKAVEADKGLRFATATLALAQAILGDDEKAARTLATLTTGDDVLEPYTLARFWMLTRFQSSEAGVALLRDTIGRHPGELLLRGYLAETLDLVGQHLEAVAAWKEYLLHAPGSPWAQARLGKSLARLGKHDEALAATKAALELDPASVDARLQLASRFIDAGKPKDAIATLTSMAGATARGEVLLRLGWAQWVGGNVDAAAPLFQQALDRASAPGEWRTRGRAFYNLALVEAKRGRPEAARVSLKASMQTGFKVRSVDPLLSAVARDLERGAFSGAAATSDAGASAGPAPRPVMLPRETSLFPIDAFGDLDPKAKRPPPPGGLVLYRF